MELTKKKIEANKKNAQKGGVKSFEGKCISSKNSIKHGILSDCLTKYDSINPKEIYDDLIEEYKPETVTQRMLVEMLAITYVKLGRCVKLEREIINESINPPEYKDIFALDETKYLVTKNDKAQLQSSHFEQLEIVYQRYEPSLIKRFIKLADKLREA